RPAESEGCRRNRRLPTVTRSPCLSASSEIRCGSGACTGGPSARAGLSYGFIFGASERRFRGTLKSSASQVTLPAQGKIGGRPAAQYVCRRQKPIRPSTSFKEQTPMRTSSALRAGPIALLALARVTTAVDAAGGGISCGVIKAHFVIGGSTGSG